MASTKLVVTLEKRDDKKNSVKFFTDNETDSVSNVYIPNAGIKTLGDPKKVKVTIEAV